MPADDTEKLWQVPRVASELTVSEAHVYRMVREKRIPFLRIGKALRFDPKDIQAYLDERRVPAVPQ